MEFVNTSYRTATKAQRATARRHWVAGSLALAVGFTVTIAPSVSSASVLDAVPESTVHPGWPTTLVYAEPGSETSTQLVESVAPIAELVKRQLGVTIKTYFTTTYAPAIEAVGAGKVQIEFDGPAEYELSLSEGQKLENIGYEIASLPSGSRGSYDYWSYGVVNPKLNPQITSLSDAKGKKVCFSDPASTSGYLYPEYGLIEAGVSPTTGVTADFVGTDSLTAVDAAKGLCQVGFSNNVSMPPIFSADHIPRSDIKIIWKSQPIPDGPLVVSKSVPASLRAALEKLLVNEANAPYLATHGYCKSVSACETIMGGGFYGWAPPNVLNVQASVGPVCKATKNPECGKSA